MLKWLGEHGAQIVTVIVAVYAAVLSTLNLLSIRKEKKRQLSVKMSWEWLAYPKRSSDTMLLIEIANPGYRPVTVQTPYIKLPRGGSLIFPWPTAEVRFPHELAEGKSCSLWVEEAEVKRCLKEKGYSGEVKLRVEVRDQTGRKYKSKKDLKFNLNK
jgi:hypothetical protein